MKKFKRVLIANRGEIAIRIIRACKELGITSVAIYSEEDKHSLFRLKADEAYLIGKGKSPVEAYLAIDDIIQMAKDKEVDAIHPGYGFLAENEEFAKACEREGIEFIGPTAYMMSRLGDKIQSKIVAKEANVQAIPGVEEAIKSDEEAKEFANSCGYPVMLKAAAGGGGRGMRIVNKEEDLIDEFHRAKSEAKKAFGIDDIFIEKYIADPKHIEVQILGDKYGNLVHLYERDCSVQRRYQKVIEFSPAICLNDEQRKSLCDDALKIARTVGYRSAGTVEFLFDEDLNHYFIEMNPRIQVEHTVSELVTGIDIVQAQILIAEGYPLDSPVINIPDQESVKQHGAAIQCRITTEDPLNDFMPDTGEIIHYTDACGFGIRLDGNGFPGAVISPYYDSLLVKVTSFGRGFEDARRKSLRALKETDISGVKTNKEFLINVIQNDTFKKGMCNTGFIAANPQLLEVAPEVNTEYKVIGFLGDKYINETKGIKPKFEHPVYPRYTKAQVAQQDGLKFLLDKEGPEAVSKYVLDQKRLMITDTTMRDAQQSLLATRVRSVDMYKVAPAAAVLEKDLFSFEMWGGATFDTAYRFLRESPWERLHKLREMIPNVPFQMLIRGANAVGYKNYPDNVIREFVRTSAEAGIDVFRIFDSLNWIEGMSVALDETLKQGKIAEPCICYTGDILDNTKTKYTLDYYVKMAKELENRGAHILGIKDMSGLLKPMAAKMLIEALKDELKIPVHLHTHDTSGNGVATLFMAAQAGVDVVDAAISSMSGLTSQPNLNSLVAALQRTDRDTGMDLDELQKIADYWAAVRPVYKNFESGLQASSAEIYKYELPGGQYSNLKPQVDSFGIGDKFQEVKDMYIEVNKMFGDIVKVTPSSKTVGDMAIFMVQNGYTPENIYEKAQGVDFPDSVVSFFEGMMGQPMGGFNAKLQKLVLKDKTPITCRPGELLPPADFDGIRKLLREEYDLEGTDEQVISYAMYDKVYTDYHKNLKVSGDFRRMGSDIFFHGLSLGESCKVEIADGKTMYIELISVSEPNEMGQRDCMFNVDGHKNVVHIIDKSAGKQTVDSVEYASEDDPGQVGANISGNVLKLLVKQGDMIVEQQPIAIMEAMKMETKVLAPISGKLKEFKVKEGQQVDSNQLIAVIQPAEVKKEEHLI
ncbi:MAG: pyruvate carboxylase [Eubacteriaceae bacterium]|nr:pyruvate carboxylase [Eubacteriaceae bacterium]